MNQLIETIISIEWNMFDKVNNVSGRAACQDDYETFHIMRKSQLDAWNKPMLKSYLSDLREAELIGRNLLSEKYAYMMELTSPDEYKSIQDQLPVRSDEKMSLIQTITQIQVSQSEALKKEYPLLQATGRPIHTSEDTPFSVSFETYLVGELSTYSMNTLLAYKAYLDELDSKNLSLNRMILENTTRQYGYASLDAAERRLQQKMQ